MNVDVRCPACSAYFSVPTTVLGKRTKCTKCGERFELTAAPPSESDHSGFDDIVIEEEAIASSKTDSVPPPPISPPQFDSRIQPTHDVEADALLARASSRTGTRTFMALRFVARFYEIMAIVVAQIGIIVLVLSLVGFISRSDVIIESGLLWDLMVATALTAFWMAMTVTGLLFVAQINRLALQVEENTYESRKAFQRIASSLQSSTRQ
jgi:hypothetical protein